LLVFGALAACAAASAAEAFPHSRLPMRVHNASGPVRVQTMAL
jgi:hypothetical protein